jgi:uncharacterized protein (TIGR02118 family)
MIQVAVKYPRTEGAKFDMDYYVEKHMPMVSERCGDALKGMTVLQGLTAGMSGEPSPNLAIGTLNFESIEAFQSAMGPHMGEIMGDIPNYTDITPVLEISEIKL